MMRWGVKDCAHNLVSGGVAPRALVFGAVLAAIGPSELPAQALAPDYGAVIDRAIDAHILPGFARLQREASELDVAASVCGENEAPLRAAYHRAFDAWIDVSHLRLGPGAAAYAIAFWPDPRGHTQRALRALMRDRNQAVDDAEAFSKISIAARGFFALERLLFDPTFLDSADGYRCRLLRAITRDISGLAARINAEWRRDDAAAMRGDGAQSDFATQKEAVQALYSLLSTGAEFTRTARVGRPVGADGRPKPKRAEAWRSGRSNRNIQRSLAALDAMFEQVFAAEIPERAALIVRSEFYAVRRMADALPKPMIDLVSDPSGRRKAIHLGFALDALRRQLDGLVRPSLGLSLTFNALDGD